MSSRSAVTYNYRRPALTQYQKDAFFCSERFAIVEATTKSGKTVSCIAWLVEEALRGTYSEYWWIAPVYTQAEIAFRRLKKGLTPGSFRSNESALSITFANGNRIVCKSAEKPDNLYGEDVGAAVIDEASRVKEAAWHAVRSTLTATRGPARIVGNVKGRKNWFYKMARRAAANDERDMRYSKITAQDAIAAGVIDADEVEGARRDLPEAVFRELYMAEASDDEGNPFGFDAIRQCIVTDDTIEASQERYSTGKAVRVHGIDLAKKQDYFVDIGLDRLRNVAEFTRFRKKPWPVVIRTIIDNVGAKGRALVDSTGVGDPILDELQSKRVGRYTGYTFTSASKQKLMEGLAVAIQSRSVGFPAGVIVDELESFEYVYTRTGVRYSAPEGLHDDIVCALALAVEADSVPTISWRVA